MDIDEDDDAQVNLAASVEKETSTKRGSSSKHRKMVIKSLELFLTVSLLSVFLSSFTGLSYLHSYTYYFSTLLFPFLTQALQRKYMFLLCNGILVFLAVLSSFCGASSLSSSSKTPGLSDGDGVQAVMLITEDDTETIALQAPAPVHPLYEEGGGAPAGASPVETIVSSAYSRVAAGAGAAAEEEKVDEEVGEGWIEDGSGGLEEKEEIVSRPTIVGEEGGENDETESEDPANTNTEELNRKIEEFIRKMKEELRLEAQQHRLIAV